MFSIQKLAKFLLKFMLSQNRVKEVYNKTKFGVFVSILNVSVLLRDRQYCGVSINTDDDNPYLQDHFASFKCIHIRTYL